MKKSDFLNYALLFLIITVIGSLASVLYIYTMQLMPNIYLFLAVFGVFVYFMGALVKLSVNTLRIQVGFACIFIVLAALLIGTYIKWNCFFGYQYAKYEMMILGYEYDFIKDFPRTFKIIRECVMGPKYFFDDILMFNSIGSWGFIDERGQLQNFVKNGSLTFIWMIEFVLLMGYPFYCLFKVKRNEKKLSGQDKIQALAA